MRRLTGVLSTSSGDTHLDVPDTRDEIGRFGATMNDLLRRRSVALA
jgi:hypothetical protein